MSAGGQSGHVDSQFSSILRPRGKALAKSISSFCSRIVKLQFIDYLLKQKENRFLGGFPHQLFTFHFSLFTFYFFCSLVAYEESAGLGIE